MDNKNRKMALINLLHEEGFYIRNIEYTDQHYYIDGRNAKGIEFDVTVEKTTDDNNKPYIDYVLDKIQEESDKIVREQDLMVLTQKELKGIDLFIDMLRKGYEEEKVTVFIFGVDTPNNIEYKREFKRRFDLLVDEVGESQTLYEFMGKTIPLGSTVMRTDLTKKYYREFLSLGYNVVGMIDE